MAQVAADIDGEVEADGAGGGVGGLGGAQQLAADGEGVLALPHHAHDGAGAHVGDEAGEEGLGGQVLVVLLQQRLGGRHHLQRHQLQALALEAGDDLANQAALDACKTMDTGNKKAADWRVEADTWRWLSNGWTTWRREAKNRNDACKGPSMSSALDVHRACGAAVAGTPISRTDAGAPMHSHFTTPTVKQPT